jgi:hypothetical protein
MPNLKSSNSSECGLFGLRISASSHNSRCQAADVYASYEDCGICLGQRDVVIALLRNREKGIDLVIIAGLARENMCLNFETLWLIERAGGNRHALATFFFEEQTRAASAAKATPKSWHGNIPFERLTLHKIERRSAACRRGNRKPARSPTLNTVAGYYIAQRAPYFICAGSLT